MSTVRENQLKIIKYNHLITNLLIFHNCRIITLALKELETKGVRLRRNFTHLRRNPYAYPVRFDDCVPTRRRSSALRARNAARSAKAISARTIRPSGFKTCAARR